MPKLGDASVFSGYRSANSRKNSDSGSENGKNGKSTIDKSSKARGTSSVIQANSKTVAGRMINDVLVEHAEPVLVMNELELEVDKIERGERVKSIKEYVVNHGVSMNEFITWENDGQNSGNNGNTVLQDFCESLYFSRPSSFNVCAMHLFKGLLVSELFYDEFVKGMSPFELFFTGVGTTVHDVLQKTVCGHSQWGRKLWGDFLCRRCGSEYKFCLKPLICENCGSGSSYIEYQEVEVKYNVIDSLLGVGGKGKKGKIKKYIPTIGHVDTILFDSPESCCVIDYKTTSNRALEAHLEYGNKFPYKHNQDQVRAYGYMLSQEPYNLPVKRTALVYVTRDLISKYVVCEDNFGEKEKTWAKNEIVRNAHQVYIAKTAVKYLLSKFSKSTLRAYVVGSKNLIDEGNLNSFGRALLSKSKVEVRNIDRNGLAVNDTGIFDKLNAEFDKAVDFMLKHRVCLNSLGIDSGINSLDNGVYNMYDYDFSSSDGEGDGSSNNSMFVKMFERNHNEVYATSDVRYWKACYLLSYCGALGVDDKVDKADNDDKTKTRKAFDRVYFNDVLISNDTEDLLI